MRDKVASPLPQRVEGSIRELAQKYGLSRVVLFGSRARQDGGERSDIDIAVWGGDAVRFALDLDESAWTLLEFDVVDMNASGTDELRQEIEADGIVLYERE